MRVEIAAEPKGVPFPQADSMEKVIDAMELINRHPDITDSDLAYYMSIVNRQGGYYGNACKYLGLTERVLKGNTYHNKISILGKEILSMPHNRRMLGIIKLIARHETFNRFISEYLEQGILPKKEDIVAYLIENVKKMSSDSDTPNRRASTVMSWIGWIINTCNTDR
jgi:hypothetical protein